MPDIAEIQNMTFDDVPDSIELQPGEYIMEVANAAVEASDDGEKYWYALKLRATQVLSEGLGIKDDDLTNAYQVRDRLFFHSEGCKKFTKGATEKILGQSVAGLAANIVAEAMIGQTVRVVLVHNIVEGKDRPYLNVDNYLKAA